MRINSVVGLNAISGRKIAFKRELKENEKPGCAKAIDEAMNYLGIVNRAMIIHGPSFPVYDDDIEQKTGTPVAADEFLDFIKVFGFNAVQLGPMGKLNDGDNSPYASSIFAKNPLFINLSLLTTDEYAGILSDDELYANTYEVDIPEQNYTKSDFADSKSVISGAISTAYKNFQQKLENKDKDAIRLNREFLDFQKNNAYWLDYYATLDVLSKKYKTDDYSVWDLKDRNLIKGLKAHDADAIDYFEKLNKENASSINSYKFTQFIVDKQLKQDEENRDVVYIGDLLVGASKFDELIFEDAFLKGVRIGAEYGGPDNSPQLWDVPFVNPDKLFNKNGTLGPAGQFIKLKLEKTLQDTENIRIDHAMGLVDPFVYAKNSVVYENKKDKDGNIIKIPVRDKLKANYLSRTKFDKNKNYQRIIPDIIIPVLKSSGLNPEDVIWEDLGADVTGVFNKVFREDNHLPGISCLAWDRGENAPEQNWAYLGCHDDKSISMVVAKGLDKDSHAWNPDYLAGYLNPSPNRAKEREQFKNDIINSKASRIKAKFADLFRSTKNIQMSFMDFFGINKQYNVPGTKSDENWTLRLSPDYQKHYYDDLANNKDAVNMPEILSIAVQAKADMDFAKGEKTERQAKAEAKPILDKLNHYSKILKEKE